MEVGYVFAPGDWIQLLKHLPKTLNCPLMTQWSSWWWQVWLRVINRKNCEFPCHYIQAVNAIWQRINRLGLIHIHIYNTYYVLKYLKNVPCDCFTVYIPLIFTHTFKISDFKQNLCCSCREIKFPGPKVTVL